jgi:hypothetical protein
LAKKLTVEGGVANKARALYAALFTADASAAAAADAAADDEEGGDSPRANGEVSNGNGNSSSNGSGGAKLGPSISVAGELLSQLAHDAPGQLAQLVALEWLLAVSSKLYEISAVACFLLAVVAWVCTCSKIWLYR